AVAVLAAALAHHALRRVRGCPASAVDVRLRSVLQPVDRRGLRALGVRHVAEDVVAVVVPDASLARRALLRRGAAAIDAGLVVVQEPVVVGRRRALLGALIAPGDVAIGIGRAALAGRAVWSARRLATAIDVRLVAVLHAVLARRLLTHGAGA